MISELHCEIDYNCSLVGYHSACIVKNWLFSSEFINVMLCIRCRFTPYHADCKSTRSNSHRL